MRAPQAAKFFRQWVRLIEKYSRARAIMQAGIKRDIISAPFLSIFNHNVGSYPLLVICHSGVSWHPA
jgi:hypothetical protein